MKPSLDKNYTIHFRRQVEEENEQVAQYYDGIYLVELNQLVSIYFVPWIQDFAAPKILLPDDLDNPASTEEARLWLCGQADYIVTCQDERSGRVWETDINFALSNEVHKCVFYCVTQEAFDRCLDQLPQLAAQMDSVYSYCRYEDVQNLEVIQTIERSVLGSLFVRPAHFAVLQRPFAQLMSVCVQTLKQHNATNTPIIYHGRFEQHSFLQSYVAGDDSYECGLFCPAHYMHRKSDLPKASAGRQFWSFHKSIESDDNFSFMLARGVSIWLDKNDPALLQLELFNIWREVDTFDWPFTAPVADVEVEPGKKERLTLNFDEIDFETFARQLIAYVSGENTLYIS